MSRPKWIPCYSWTDFQRRLSSELYSGGGFQPGRYAFRGQADANWRLESSYDRWFARSQRPPGERTELYKRLLKSFRKELLYIGRELPMADDAKPTKELQAFAQHYELPTRLLDWSESPYIAAFFAFKDCLLAKEQSENVAIWALDRRAPIWTEDHGATLEEIDGPSNERMLNQRGLFTVATFSHACLEEYVESFDDLRPGTLIQFTIPSRIAALALEELSAMGLTETRLYPEPDGCARSVLLRYHLESLPSQRPEILIEYADPLGSPIHAQSAGCRFSPEASQMKSEQYLLIIGRRGSGKSYRLNALRERHRQSGFHCTEIETVPLATELVHKVWSRHDNIDGGHTWERLWQCAILRSTISYIKHDVTLKQLNSLLNVDKYSNLLSTYARPLGPYGQLSDMIASHAEQGLSQLFQSSEWDSLTDDLRRALADKSLYFYIDSFEDVFSGDPLHWQECQKSLLDFAKTRLCELKLNLRFVIAIQDTTFLSWVGTNQTKLVDNCRHEIWTKERLTDFIKERLAAMPAKYWRGQKTFPKSFEEWFQMDTIRNERREIDEVLTEYLMRHSRMLPSVVLR